MCGACVNTCWLQRSFTCLRLPAFSASGKRSRLAHSVPQAGGCTPRFSAHRWPGPPFRHSSAVIRRREARPPLRRLPQPLGLLTRTQWHRESLAGEQPSRRTEADVRQRLSWTCSVPTRSPLCGVPMPLIILLTRSLDSAGNERSGCRYVPIRRRASTGGTLGTNSPEPPAVASGCRHFGREHFVGLMPRRPWPCCRQRKCSLSALYALTKRKTDLSLGEAFFVPPRHGVAIDVQLREERPLRATEATTIVISDATVKTASATQCTKPLPPLVDHTTNISTSSRAKASGCQIGIARQRCVNRPRTISLDRSAA